MIGKSLIAFAVAIAVLTQVPVASAQGTCQNPSQFSQCMLAFVSNLGFSGFPYNETVFDETLSTYLHRNDIAGWNNLRAWTTTFVTCSGGATNYDACIDHHNFMNVFGISEREAIQYEADFRVNEYEMGPAFDVIVRNWFCIKQVDQTEGPVVQACRQHFQDQEHNNPNNTCRHLGELLNCVERPYVQHCGRDVAAVVCNIEKILYSIFSPECNAHVALHCRGTFNPLKKGAKFTSIKLS